MRYAVKPFHPAQLQVRCRPFVSEEANVNWLNRPIYEPGAPLCIAHGQKWLSLWERLQLLFFGKIEIVAYAPGREIEICSDLPSGHMYRAVPI